MIFFFLLVNASFLVLSFCFLNFLILNFEIWIFFSSNIANKIKCMQRKINMTTIFFPLDSASFPHFIFNFRILKFEFFFFWTHCIKQMDRVIDPGWGEPWVKDKLTSSWRCKTLDLGKICVRFSCWYHGFVPTWYIRKGQN